MKKRSLFVLPLALSLSASAQIQLEHSYPKGELQRIPLDVSGEKYLLADNCWVKLFGSEHNIQTAFGLVSPDQCGAFVLTEKIMDEDSDIEVLYGWNDASIQGHFGYAYLNNGIAIDLGKGTTTLSRIHGLPNKLISGGTVFRLPGRFQEHVYSTSIHTKVERKLFPADGERYIVRNTDAFTGFHFYDAHHALVKSVNLGHPGFSSLNHITQHYFNQDDLLEFFGCRKAASPDKHGNCCVCEVVQEDGNVLFSMPAQSCRISTLPGHPDQIIVQQHGEQDQWKTSIVDTGPLQVLHTFDGRMTRSCGPHGPVFYIDEYVTPIASPRKIYNENYGLHKTLALPHIWNLGSTRGQFSDGDKIELFFTTQGGDGKPLVRCIDEDGTMLYEFPKAIEADLDRQPGLEDKFFVKYHHVSYLDSTSVFQFAKSTSTKPPAEGGHFVVSPNPFRESLLVTLPTTSDFRLTLFASNGRMICTKEFFQTDNGDLSGSGLARGLYFLQVEAGGRTTTRRVVKVE